MIITAATEAVEVTSGTQNTASTDVQRLMGRVPADIRA
jgi:hypothetical protein